MLHISIGSARIIPVLLSVLLFIPSISYSADYTVVQLTNNFSIEDSARINNNGYIVWDSLAYGEDAEIFLYDGVVARQLTDNAIDDYAPQINDSGHAVWAGYDGWEGQVFLYNGSGAVQISTNTVLYADDPKVNDNDVVVWTEMYNSEDRNIALYDGSDVTMLTDTLDNAGHDINNHDHVVWASGPEIDDSEEGSEWEIFYAYPTNPDDGGGNDTVDDDDDDTGGDGEDDGGDAGDVDAGGDAGNVGDGDTSGDTGDGGSGGGGCFISGFF